MSHTRLVSYHFPYLTVHVEVNGHTFNLEMLIDTGFDGDLTLPQHLLADVTAPDGYLTCQLADGSQVVTPVYRGTASALPSTTFPVLVIALGDEPLVLQRRKFS
jgi:predicted aspartyl protease